MERISCLSRKFARRLRERSIDFAACAVNEAEFEMKDRGWVLY